MANRRFNQFFYSMHKKPVVITSKFSITSTTSTGVTAPTSLTAGSFGGTISGSTSLGGGIKQVLAYSSAPATGNNFLQGTFGVQLQDNYASYFGMNYSLSGVVTGSAVNVTTGLTLGQLYQIVTVGTTTTAAWQTLGVPAGITPVVGLAFSAATASVGTGTGTVKALASSNLTSIEVASDPNYTLQPVGQASGFNGGSGGWIYFNCWKTATLTQPTDGTIVWLNLYLNSP